RDKLVTGVQDVCSSDLADPVNAKNSQQIQAVCPGAAPYTVVVNGNGEFTPAHLIGSTSVFIPTAFDTTFTFTPPGGSTMTNHDKIGRASCRERGETRGR